MKKVFEEKVRLNFGQSLMVGNLNNIHLLDNIIEVGAEVASQKMLEIQKFGLFETSTPNFLTYYPDVKPEDLVADEEDFIKPVFRALSEVIVHKQWNPIDFAKNNVLKKSMDMLIGQTIYGNHEMFIGNEVGAVPDVTWQKSYTTASGIVVPAGINAIFKIDGKSHPNITRKITMSPPAIHSCSVSVQFAWEQSHPQMDVNEFWSKFGSYAEDGELIRKVVTEIKAYHEISLVSHGADHYAQVTDEKGQIVNPRYADNMANLSEQTKEKIRQSVYFSYKDDIVQLSAKPAIPKEPILNPEESAIFMKDQYARLALILGYTLVMTGDIASFSKDGKDFTLEQFETEFKNLNTAAQSVAALTQRAVTAEGQVISLTGERDAFKTEVDTLKAAGTSNQGTEALTALVGEVTAAYKKIKGDKFSADFVTSLASMDVKALQNLNKEYAEQLEAKFPLTCAGCGSHEVTRNSAVLGDDENSDLTGKGKKDEPAKIKSNSDVLAQLRRNNIDASSLHGKTDK